MPSLSNYPNARPSLLLDFASSGLVDPRVQVTRATTATRINARGLIENVAANVPRINYDPFTGECLGLLNEVSRTNEIIQSEFATGIAGIPSSGVTATNFPGFAGGVSVQLNSAGAYVYKSVATVVGTSYYFGFLLLMDDGGDATLGVDFSVVFTGGVVPATVKKLGGGLHLVQTTQVVSGTNTFFGVVKYANQSARGFKVTAYDRQAGGFPTSYIPTTTAAVTRAAENIIIGGASFLEIFNQEQGTLYVEGIQDGNYGGWFAGLSSGTASDRTGVYMSGTQVRSVAYLGAVAQTNLSVNAPLTGQSKKAAFAMQKDNFAVSVNGSVAVTGAAGSVPAFTQMSIGNAHWGATESFCGCIKRIAYYPTRLSNAQLQALTAP